MENGKWILTRISSYTIRILRGEGKKKNVRDKSGKYRKIYVVTNMDDEKICLGVSIYVIELFGSF